MTDKDQASPVTVEGPMDAALLQLGTLRDELRRLADHANAALTKALYASPALPAPSVDMQEVERLTHLLWVAAEQFGVAVGDPSFSITTASQRATAAHTARTALLDYIRTAVGASTDSSEKGGEPVCCTRCGYIVLPGQCADGDPECPVLRIPGSSNDQQEGGNGR